MTVFLADGMSQSSSCGRSEVINTQNKILIQLDISQYQPDVKLVDESVVIHGKHEEDGWVSREFTRPYMLPTEVEPQALTSKLTANGVLRRC
ncbi:CRYAB [Cordylochernes scorpioides]|uniref:CRYAB n=1 Tax=Cordylochernes scorpioides TaxID=51811 RepID=A0ABY6KP99_9ARAC|nr:CRYAB [Cordylochernes scorpioides]